MTSLLEQPKLEASEPKTIERVAIVVSKGSLEGVYPALILANGARMGRDRSRSLLHLLRARRHSQEPLREDQGRNRRQPVHDSGAHLYACKASVDMFRLTMEDFVPQVEDIISVGEFYEKAAGGEIIFT